MQRAVWTLTCLALVVPGIESLEAQPELLGEEFQVNTYTSASQAFPTAGMDSSGGFVVVWSSTGSVGADTSANSIQGRLYASDGSVVGAQFEVNTYTTGGQYFANVAMSPAGEFVVLWRSVGSPGSDLLGDSVQGRRYASDGLAIGDQFQVNTYTTDGQRRPALAMHPGGDFVVVWQSSGSTGTDNDSLSIQGQRYASDGSTVGGEFQVNSFVSSIQREPSVAVGPGGEFVVVWDSGLSGGSDDWGPSIQGRRFASDGSAVGEDFQVNTYTSSYQVEPDVAIRPDGDFVVVWYSDGSPGDDAFGYSIQAQRFASDGSALGTQFQVNPGDGNHQRHPDVLTHFDGSFVTVWHSWEAGGADSTQYSIQGQRYGPDGTASGTEFQINTYSPSSQQRSSVAGAPEGDFVVVWMSYGSSGTDTSGASIQGQRVEGPSRIFKDGFESGDTTAWQ